MKKIRKQNSKRVAAYCVACNKRGYISRKDARAVIRDAHQGEGMRAYVCPVHPTLWHIGHIPQVTRERGVPASTIFESSYRRRRS